MRFINKVDAGLCTQGQIIGSKDCGQRAYSKHDFTQHLRHQHRNKAYENKNKARMNYHISHCSHLYSHHSSFRHAGARVP
ncbi:hypothetical protein EVA_15407 [gut metagenome]|uniref:Uncharacterized protein n=1 Tax=gut metagenome TaxID=749906 RepID=J9C9A9_9ZZZZ